MRPRRQLLHRTSLLLVAAVTAATVTAACGDSGDRESADERLSAYCELSRRLSTGDLPSDEDLGELRELAPDAIEPEVRVVERAVAKAVGADGKRAVFTRPDVRAAVEEIERFERRSCSA